MKGLLFSIITLVLISASGSYAAEPPKSEQLTSFVKSEDVIGRKIGEYRLIDQDGKEFSTSEFTGKPLVVSFIYTSCVHICPTITLSLSNVTKEKKERLGKDFNILTVSFDPDRDTPQRLKEFGSNFTKEFGHWRFSTASRETIDMMARDFGFYYKKEGDSFQHINMVSVVDGNGHVLTHIYGIDFRPVQVLDPIYFPEMFKKGENAGFAGLLEKVTIFCYKYDPSTNSYRLDYPLLFQMTLEGTVLFSILFFVWKKEIIGFFSRIRGKKAADNV